jgi:predicted 3-demethylubiquinone-9 3-methyltransferase (glyoxalase superfamily)
MPSITPFLWFASQAQEAAEYYVSVFEDSRITKVTRYPEATREITREIPGAPPPGSIQTVEFELRGQRFVALNGGKVPGFEFSPATSFEVDCQDQAEVDRLWEALSAVPEAEQCGWCQDKFGVTWQIVPTALIRMLDDPDPAKVERVTAAFLPMKKLDIAALEKAYAG